MPTPLQEIGSPRVGEGIALGIQSNGTNCRVITRRFRMRIEDQASYLVALINPTLYDSVFTSAVIVGQEIRAKAEDHADCELVRVFAEVPTPYDEYIERAVTFPGVSPSKLYTPADFRFRDTQVSRWASGRLARAYFLSNPRDIPVYPEFHPTDQQGVEVTTIDDNTIPSADEYIALVQGKGEIIKESVVKQWKGDIWVRETLYINPQ
jgi:hypothetical protein